MYSSAQIVNRECRKHDRFFADLRTIFQVISLSFGLVYLGYFLTANKNFPALCTETHNTGEF